MSNTAPESIVPSAAAVAGRGGLCPALPATARDAGGDQCGRATSTGDSAGSFAFFFFGPTRMILGSPT